MYTFAETVGVEPHRGANLGPSGCKAPKRSVRRTVSSECPGSICVDPGHATIYFALVQASVYRLPLAEWISVARMTGVSCFVFAYLVDPLDAPFPNTRHSAVIEALRPKNRSANLLRSSPAKVWTSALLGLIP
jgi:hypothetical protein